MVSHVRVMGEGLIAGWVRQSVLYNRFTGSNQ